MPNEFRSLLIVLISINTLAAYINHIDDVDEVFGYYEPLHYLLFNNAGMQTWEYSPDYALRSYAFISPFIVIGKLLVSLSTLSKQELFLTFRLILAVFTSICQARLVSVAYERYKGNTMLLTLTFIALSPGIFYCSTSFLPSAVASSFVMLATSSWLLGEGLMTVLWGSLAAIFTGWPFCSLLFLPYGSYFLIVKKPSVSLKLIYCIQSALILCSILLTCSVIDFHMYGKTTSPLWNILQYNAIGGKGDELYGVEPAAYYIRNLFLTMGIAWPLASVAPILILCSLLLKIKSQKEFQNEMHQLVLCAPVILWLALLFRRPHKEERFMYPIYPLLALLSSFSVEYMTSLIIDTLLSQRRMSTKKLARFAIVACVILGAGVIGVSRVISNYNNFNGYMSLWKQVHTYTGSTTTNTGTIHSLCIGGDWYTFPSHFFLPAHIRLEFIKDGFYGQLPYHFSSINGTSAIPEQPFNSLNKMEESRFKQLDECDFIVLHLHRQGDSGTIEETVLSRPSDFQFKFSTLVLDSEHSPGLARAFYIPGMSRATNKFNEYALFARTMHDVKI